MRFPSKGQMASIGRRMAASHEPSMSQLTREGNRQLGSNSGASGDEGSKNNNQQDRDSSGQIRIEIKTSVRVGGRQRRS